MKLQGKVAVITGAASGMGREQAKLFAQEGAGIVAVDINEEGLEQLKSDINGTSGDIVTVQADITEKDSVQNIVDQTLEHFKTIDVLCNTAGMLDDFKPLLDGDEELWDKIFSINVKGPFLLTKAVLPTMIDKGKGNIINIASIAGKMAGGGGAAYTSTKHAMNGFTKQLSYDYGQKGIRVNAIAPGYIRTAMTEGVDEAMVENTPAGRPGEANEIAKLSLFLASDDSDYIHGETITIDGGLTIGI